MDAQIILITLIFALNVWIWFLLYHVIRLRRKNKELKSYNQWLKMVSGVEDDMENK